MQNFTQDNPDNLPLITSHGDNFIKINNTNKIINNVVLFSDGKYKLINNLVNNINNLDTYILKKIFDSYYLNKDILLVGCGKKYMIPNSILRTFVSENGFVLEWMTTKSAINTWNLLLEDFRDVIFLLLWE